MKKLVHGIVDFRKTRLADYRQRFSHLKKGQSPDTLMIACSDSRVVPNTFASTDPGDLFVVRNVGNLVPVCGECGMSSADESEAAAIEFSVCELGVSDIVVCGHSECGAIETLHRGRDLVAHPNLRAWLRHGEETLKRIDHCPELGKGRKHLSRLSQLNVLCQIEHLKTYPIVQQRITQGKLRLHAWWFDIGQADVYSYEETASQFVLIDEAEAEKIVARLQR